MADPISSIVILSAEAAGDAESLKRICLGVEEEGIPFEVRRNPGGSAAKLAYEAALASRLDVGIGIGTDHAAAVHFSGMEEETPLFTCSGHSDGRDQRILGINAARLVKGLPFKAF